MWQLIRERARLDLGRELDVDRVRTLAAAGSQIIGWLASSNAADAASGDAVEAAQSWLAAAAAPG